MITCVDCCVETIYAEHIREDVRITGLQVHADTNALAIQLPPRKDRKSLATQAFEAFLPAGYPDSVGDDYLR